MSDTSAGASSVPPPPSAGSTTPSTSTTAYSATSTTSHSTVMTPSTVAVNGDMVKEEAESSKMANGGSHDPCFHDVNLSSYIYQAGFVDQQWSDVQLDFADQSFKLHRLVLSRSPFLVRLMSPLPPGSTVKLAIPDDDVTLEALQICLRHLYSPSLQLVTASNARQVLATAFTLEGMPELIHHAYLVSRDSLSPDNILDFVQWLSPSPSSVPLMNGNAHVTNGTMFGSVNSRDGTVTLSSETGAAWKEEGNERYGEWSVRLQHDVMDYLVHALPQLASPVTENPSLISVYTHLPYDLFKHCMESSDLPIDSTQARFAFTKKLISQRKKTASGSMMDEGVVLAVGSHSGMVHITRKPKRSQSKSFYKVAGQ